MSNLSPYHIHLDKIKTILNVFEDVDLSLLEFLTCLCTTEIFTDRPLVSQMPKDIGKVLEMLNSSTMLSEKVIKWMMSKAESAYQSQLLHLTRKITGFHFVAKKITSVQLMEETIVEIGKRMEMHAPFLWSLFSSLLLSDPALAAQRAQGAIAQAQKGDMRQPDGDISMMDPNGYCAEWESEGEQSIGGEFGTSMPVFRICAGQESEWRLPSMWYLPL
ncbi:hypothetical protein BJ165DRAFT_1522641 [Panaeolus papilionaceus]|nr:hypothetical protein BJ165DRAFT_1522641 [Panaeolus papilionaceus]